MPRTELTAATIVFLVVAGTCPLLAQIGRPLAPPRPGRARVEPCWERVGISKAAMQERAAISRETRSQVEGVCADAALAPQQKQQRIREIHLQAKQRMDALVSPQQQEALQACQRERTANRPPSPGLHRGGGGTGPCGELLPPAGHPPVTAGHPENEKPPAEEDTSPQN